MHRCTDEQAEQLAIYTICSDHIIHTSDHMLKYIKFPCFAHIADLLFHQHIQKFVGITISDFFP